MSKTKKTSGETPAGIKYTRYSRRGFGQVSYWADTRENDLKIFEMEQQSDSGAFGVERIKEVVSQAKALLEKIPSPKEEIGLINDDVLLTAIIYNGSNIIGGKLDTNYLIEAVSELSEAVTIYNHLQIKDAHGHKPRNRKSLKPYIREALQELGLNANERDIYVWLKENNIVTENTDKPEKIIWIDGEIGQAHFRNIISEIKKLFRVRS